MLTAFVIGMSCCSTKRVHHLFVAATSLSRPSSQLLQGWLMKRAHCPPRHLGMHSTYSSSRNSTAFFNGAVGAAMRAMQRLTEVWEIL